MPGWFEEQIIQRIKADEQTFSNALKETAEVITGRKIYDEKPENEIQASDKAIREIAHYYKIPDEVFTKQETQTAETLSHRLEQVFGPYGIMRRTVELTKGWYKDASGIYLGKTKSGHYAALMPDYYGYSYKDPETGKKIRVNSRTQENLEPDATCFYTPLPMHKLTVLDLMRYMVKSIAISDVFYVALISLLVTLCSMAAPFLTRILYSQVIYSKNISNLNAIFFFIVMAAVSVALLQIARTLTVSRINMKTSMSLNSAVMMRVINLPAIFFRKYSSGELAQRAMIVTGLCQAIVNIVFSAGLTVLMSFIYLAQIFVFTPALVKPALGITLVLLISSIIITYGNSVLMNKKVKLKAKEYGMLYAFITGIQKIKLSGSERRAFAKWASVFSEKAKLEYNPPLYIKLTNVIEPIIMLIGTFILYWSAYKAGVSAENYMAFMASYSLMSASFILLSQVNIMTATISPLIDMIKPILESVPEISSGKIVSRVRGGIELNDVTFRYSEKSPIILDRLTLKIRPGEYVAIVGKSGCGKSTLMRLLLGFETPNSGVIYYDGNDLKTLDLKSLRSNIGCVMQNSTLFPGSLYSNIVISAPQLGENEAWAAAEMAGMAEDIRKMPMQMNMLISEGSGTISGGQRQRIIIARAIAPKPKILLFDEATSALDNITQKIVSDSLEKLKCTRIVIAHRLSTVRHCDRILVLDGGNIAEEGNYDELIALNGIFASLVKRQQLGEIV